MIAVLCGGVGAARFLAALAHVVDPSDTVGIVNTADDTVLHGLAISPDLDTVTYTLANAIDPDRGWGLSDESWRAMEALQRYADVRPQRSVAAPTWFNLGDRDLATHFYRTARLGEGATLSEVTAEICAAWQVRQRLIPMSDQTVSTVVTLADGGDVSFQEYFVKLHHAVPVTAVRFVGASEATPCSGRRGGFEVGGLHRDRSVQSDRVDRPDSCTRRGRPDPRRAGDRRSWPSRRSSAARH